MPSLDESLEALFAAERTVRKVHGELAAASRADLVKAIEAATKKGLDEDNEAEQNLRLTRLALLLGDLDGDHVVDLLVDILGSDSSEARIAAGEQLEALAFDRWKEVATGIERAVGRLPNGSPALTELPFLLAEVAEPGVVKLLGRFLKHDDAEAVASAIEAIAELGDPAAIPLLQHLERDGRQVQIEEEGERVALGDLAHETRELLEQMMEDANAEPKRGPGKGR